MEHSIADFLKDSFPDFEHLHFGEDTETAHSDNIPETETVMEDENNHRADHVSWTESDLDIAKTESFMNTDMEVENKTCSGKEGLFEEQSMKTRSVVYGSLDDYDSDDKTEAEDQHEEKHKDDTFQIRTNTPDIQQMIEQQAYMQVEDVSFLEMAPEEAQGKVKYQMVMEEKTSHLLSFQMVDKPEDRSSSSSSSEDRTDLESIEEHIFQHTPDNNEPNCLIKFQGCATMSTDVQSRHDVKEFTEDDHVKVEEGLADYPSDLSQSENEDCSEGHEDEASTHMNTKLREVHLQDNEEHSFHQMENLAVTSTDDDAESKERSINAADTFIKNDTVDVEDVFKNYQFLNNSYGDKENCGISNTDTESVENFQSVASTVGSSEGYMNEQPDYDISSDDDDYNRSQEEEHEPIAHTRKKEGNIASHEQENIFTVDTVGDWKTVECGEADMNNLEIRDVGGLSDVPAFPDDGIDGSSAYETKNSNSSVSHLPHSGSSSGKPDQRKTEHNSEPLEVSNIEDKQDNLNTLLPETFWTSIDEDNLKLDEYEWDINTEEEIFDDDDNFLEELENEEEKMERDWEKEQARIQAFDRYYKSIEGEEFASRSHKVTFCLETELTQYEEECSSSEEELSTNSCVSELHPAEPGLVNLHQSNKEHKSEPLEVSCAGENIHNIQPETLWSSTLMMDEDNIKLNEYDHDVHREDFSSKVMCVEKKCFLEEQINDGQEMKRDLEQEVNLFNRYHEEFVGGEENEEVTDRSHDVMFSLDKESQNEENESSEQESNTEDDTSNRKIEEQSESDEPQERRLYSGRQKVLPKGLQKPDKKLKEPKSKCFVLLKSVLAVSLATVVGVLSYWWAADNLDWKN